MAPAAATMPASGSLAPAAAAEDSCSPGTGTSTGTQRTASDYAALLGKVSYRLVIAYDGTDYCGWQLQPVAPTVQRQIEGALGVALREDREKLGVCAAGRTDSGVHARGQVVQFFSDRADLQPDKMPYKLNSLLPHDIRVLQLTKTAPDFNVSFSACGKTYHYHVHNARTHDPTSTRYCMHVPQPLDVPAMRAAAALLVGSHDFTQLSSNGLDRLKRTPIKTLLRVDVVELAGDSPGGPNLRIEVHGNGFLYKMVRHISGALVAVGTGRLKVDAIPRMLQLGAQEAPGRGGLHRGYNVAPAKGLFLHEVHYLPEVDDPGVLLYPDLPHDEYGRIVGNIPGKVTDED